MLAVKEIKVCDKESGEITDKNIKPHWSSKFMQDSLSSLIDNLSGEINKNKCKGCMDKSLLVINKSLLII